MYNELSKLNFYYNGNELLSSNKKVCFGYSTDGYNIYPVIAMTQGEYRSVDRTHEVVEKNEFNFLCYKQSECIYKVNEYPKASFANIQNVLEKIRQELRDQYTKEEEKKRKLIVKGKDLVSPLKNLLIKTQPATEVLKNIKNQD